MNAFMSVFISMLLGGTESIAIKSKVPAWARKTLCATIITCYLILLTLATIVLITVTETIIRVIMIVLLALLFYVFYKFMKRFKTIVIDSKKTEADEK